jgi:hypothetical protein
MWAVHVTQRDLRTGIATESALPQPHPTMLGALRAASAHNWICRQSAAGYRATHESRGRAVPLKSTQEESNAATATRA